jgi:hypothetical protein
VTERVGPIQAFWTPTANVSAKGPWLGNTGTLTKAIFKTEKCTAMARTHLPTVMSTKVSSARARKRVQAFTSVGRTASISGTGRQASSMAMV